MSSAGEFLPTPNLHQRSDSGKIDRVASIGDVFIADVFIADVFELDHEYVRHFQL
jgi:hypothetical protein